MRCEKGQSKLLRELCGGEGQLPAKVPGFVGHESAGDADSGEGGIIFAGESRSCRLCSESPAERNWPSSKCFCLSSRKISGAEGEMNMRQAQLADGLQRVPAFRRRAETNCKRPGRGIEFA